MKKNIYTLIVLLSITNLFNEVSAQRVAAGGWHSIVVCSDSTVKGFGENATGQLGDGTNNDNSNPVTVTGLSGVIAVSGGGDQLEAHSMALKSDGTVWAWGSNLYGGLGNASTTNTTTPVQSLLLNNVVAISAGGWHSSALKNDGTVWVWGWNTDGQLGDGTTTDKTIATQVPGLTGVIAIAAGTYHMLALKNDSTVWAWGDNVSGQIGDGTTGTDRTSPVQVSGLTGVVKITAGRFFSLAVKSDGTVWTWGENLYGQLGNGGVADSNVPVQVTGLTGVVSATAATGAFHVLAEKNDNTVWAWGRNTYGNLGDNTVNHSSFPVQMQGISNVAGMAAGTNFSLVFKDDGTFWGCGRNASGQLGDGTVTQHNVLTQSPGVCTILSVEIENHNTGFASVNAFPNPSADGKFTVELSGISQQLSEGIVDIYNLLGNKISQSAINLNNSETSISVDLSKHVAGIYFLNISADGQHISKKLIKQ